MAQRIQTICDVHQSHDQTVDGLSWSITIAAPGDNPVTYTIDLCDEDGRDLVKLTELLAAFGRRSSSGTHRKAKTEPSPTPCPLCDKVPRNRAALATHLRELHDGITVADALGEDTPHRCPDCGAGASTAAGLGSHRWRAHGVQGTQRDGGAESA